jgi:hypothetical protein
LDKEDERLLLGGVSKRYVLYYDDDIDRKYDKASMMFNLIPQAMANPRFGV